MELKNKIIATIVSLGTVVGAISAFFAFDDRYNNATIVQSIQSAKVEIVSEMRTEVGTNRSALISLLQRDADDLEFEISELERKGEDVPRFKIERHKATLRQIEELKKDEEISDSSM